MSWMRPARTSNGLPAVGDPTMGTVAILVAMLIAGAVRPNPKH
jgi:hypothetical protein